MVYLEGTRVKVFNYGGEKALRLRKLMVDTWTKPLSQFVFP